jgi:hypothetical protein
MFRKNSLLFMWKVLTDPRLITAHFLALLRLVVSRRSDPQLASSIVRACAQLPELLVRKHIGRRRLAVTDLEVLRRAAPQGSDRRPAAPLTSQDSVAPVPLKTLLVGVAADLAAALLIHRRRTGPWGIDPREPPHSTLVIRSGSASQVRDAVSQIRARFPAAEITVLAPESLMTETAQATGEAVMPAPGAAVVSYQVNRGIVSELRRKGFDTVVLAGDSSRRAEMLALLAGPGRRVAVRDDGTAHEFRLALSRPAALALLLAWRIVERVAVALCLTLTWGALQAEGVVWALRRLILPGGRGIGARNPDHR